MDKKQEELQKMYALRAGLSVISQKSDNNKHLENECKQERAKLDKYSITSENDVEKIYSDAVSKARNDNWTEQNANTRSTNRNKIVKKKGLQMAFVLSPILTVLGIVGIVLFISFLTGRIDAFWTMFISYVTLPLAPVGIGLFFVGIVQNKKAKQTIANNMYKNNKLEEDLKSTIHRLDIVKQNNYNALAKFQDAQKETKLVLVDIKSRQEIIKKESQGIEKVLIKEFGNLLDIRDWENLDLVIYYYETGRADSVKEALQLVDNEKRNNMLIQAIGIATNEICRSIQTLGEVIVAGFNSLSAQLEAQRIQTLGALQQINDNISGVLTQQTLNNALLAKANISSKEMVEQMKQLNRKIKSA